jgi:hypothetical protein
VSWENNWGPGVKFMYRRLKLNKSLTTTSLAQMGDDGKRVEEVKIRNAAVDRYDKAIQLWQSHGLDRKGTWPSDRVISEYVKLVEMREKYGEYP